ncbi:hypothetical protein CRM22_007720 [Opisthorchis felineus]|uniref:Neutral sphingomyelinase n=3 Tax=Opisthorchiidae TaxID=6196 RepID=A0A4S2LLK5_OPIFE|nr:hypothetical protein CSKR_107465 [Clonorchis sinensis]TGZ61958.1 hypothetical protein CRM22_007720 [Opisthorchis felineus]TGZ61959.1 hypothetical protein CRM22_007720 [Opisthorchis felineus]GAA51373.1 hypothetical protein CLF_106004 [Clonorchis sinensis]
MIELRRLSTILLGLAISLVIIGIATNHWGCGSLFEGCQYRDKDATIAVLVLLLIGAVCLAVVFILDLIGLCSDVFVVSAGYLTTRFVLLYLGSAFLLIGILVFTGKKMFAWSYFLATVGTVFAMQVAILAIMSSRCVTGTQRVVVRTT